MFSACARLLKILFTFLSRNERPDESLNLIGSRRLDLFSVEKNGERDDSDNSSCDRFIHTYILYHAI